MSDRRIDAFFYGLFMDVEILSAAGVAPISPRRAYVDDFALRIGQRATLVPSPGGRAYGMLFALTHSELEGLYAAPGLEQYRAEAVLAQPLQGAPTPALCYNLREAPQPHERNPEYAARLQRALTKLDFPPEYVASVLTGSRAVEMRGGTVTRQLISSGSTFESEIGYSRAVVDDEWIFVSGTTGFDYQSMTISDSLTGQTEQCLRNIQSALAQAGAGLRDVVRVRYILPRAEDFPQCWPILRKYFGDVRPAATMIAAGLADPRIRIEIEVTARRHAGDSPARKAGG